MRDKVNIAFVSEGSLANLLFNLNYIRAFRKKFSEDRYRVTLFGHDDTPVNTYLGESIDYINVIKPRSDFAGGAKVRDEAAQADDFDLCVFFRFYPEVLHESDRMSREWKLHKQVQSWRRFRDDIATRKFFDTNPTYDFNIYIYSYLNGKMCLNARDVDDAFGLVADYDPPLLPPHGDETAALGQYGLLSGKYITIHTGKPPHASVAHPTRLWPAENYEILTERLKKAYPGCPVVQIGTEGNAALAGADMVLAGQQSFPLFAAVLRHSKVHIGIDSGAVHLRRAMGAGPSVVLFGPTPKVYFGYAKNINIQKTVCPHWCAGLTDTWRNTCLVGQVPACMDAISVEEVFKAVEGCIKQ